MVKNVKLYLAITKRILRMYLVEDLKLIKTSFNVFMMNELLLLQEKDNARIVLKNKGTIQKENLKKFLNLCQKVWG